MAVVANWLCGRKIELTWKVSGWMCCMGSPFTRTFHAEAQPAFRLASTKSDGYSEICCAAFVSYFVFNLFINIFICSFSFLPKKWVEAGRVACVSELNHCSCKVPVHRPQRNTVVETPLGYCCRLSQCNLLKASEPCYIHNCGTKLLWNCECTIKIM